MPVRVLLRYVARYRARYVVGFGFLVATTLCALAVPWVVKGTIEVLSARTPGATRAAMTGALWVVGLALLQAVSRSASRLLLLGAGQRVEAAIRADLFRHFLTLSPDFYQARRTGDLMSRATNDLSAVRMMIGPAVMYLTNTIITAIVSLTLMFMVDVRLTLVALIPLPIVSITPFVIIAFELTILFGALSGLLGFLVHGRFPRFKPEPRYDMQFTNDRFGVVIRCAAADRPRAEALLRKAGATEVTGAPA